MQPTRSRSARTFLLVIVAAFALLAAACGSDSSDTTTSTTDARGGASSTTGGGEPTELGGTLVIYSGRSLELVGPILEQFEAETGVDVEIREGDTAEMAAQILEEGDNSPADVFFGQDAGALGALAAAGRLAPLDDETLEIVDEGVRSAEGLWVGVSGRARVLVYNPDRISEDELPDSVLELAEPEWAGKVGWAPTNGSFQAFVTALRVLEGEDEAEAWLQGMKDNGTLVFEGNNDILDAVAAGGSSDPVVGLVNHYYLLQRLVETPDIDAANHYFTNGDVGGLVNVAGVGVLKTSSNPAAAHALVEFLLSETAQTYFLEETMEVPLVAGMPAPEGVPSLDSITLPEIDLNSLEDLQGTLELLTSVGIV
jgi:iron(III) transport system substrate-binding protein